MAVVLKYHIQPSQFFLAPDFQKEALQDETSVQAVLAKVLKIRKRNDPNDKILKSITTQTCAENVGHLRTLSDMQWSQLRIPAMCRTYLKHLVKQSIGLTHIQQLECDFNNGEKYELDSLADNLESLANMGFNRPKIMEALLSTQNKGIDMACNYLFLDADSQKKEREKARLTIGKFVSADNHHSQISARVAAQHLPHMGKLKRQESIVELRKSVEELKAEVNKARDKRQTLQKQVEAEQTQRTSNRYQAFLAGLLGDSKINAVELQQLNTFRQKNDVQEKLHLEVLSTLGFTEQRFEGLKHFEDMCAEENECVICYDAMSDHLIMDCAHLCICRKCGDANLKEDRSCPVCRKDITRIVQVHFS